MNVYATAPQVGDLIMVSYSESSDLCFWGIPLEYSHDYKIMLKFSESGIKKRKKSASIKQLIPLNKPMIQQVCKVEKNIIEVSNKSLRKDLKPCQEQYNKTCRLASMIENLEHLMHIDHDTLYRDLVAPFVFVEPDEDDETEEEQLHCWDRYITGNIIPDTKYAPFVTNFINKVANMDITKTISMVIKLNCFKSNGIAAIRTVLSQNWNLDSKKWTLKIIYSNPPNYTIELTSKDPEIANKYNEILARIKTSAINNGCNIVLPIHPRRKLTPDEITALSTDTIDRTILPELASDMTKLKNGNIEPFAHIEGYTLIPSSTKLPSDIQDRIKLYREYHNL